MKKKVSAKKDWRKYWKLGVSEFNTQYFNVTKDGELTVKEGNYIYNIHQIVKKYGSSMEIVFPFILEDRLSDLIEYFDAYMKIYGYRGKFFYHYPMKVNQNKEFIMPLLSEGAHMEVTSANELYLIKKLWEGEKFHSKIRVLCNGPKTGAYLDLIIELKSKGLNIIPIAEDEGELEDLVKIRGDIGVRVDLDMKADSRWDKKIDRFGISEKKVLALSKIKNLKIMHYHMGSQISTQKSLLEGVKRGFDIYAKMTKIHPNLDTLDIGGGMSIPYEKKKFYTAKIMANKIVKLLKKMSDKAGIRHPNLAVEWGQYVTAPAQMTIYKAIAEKPIYKGNAKSWYVIDGSFMNDLIDTWAIHQKWHVAPVNNANSKDLKRVWLAGSSCDSDDKYTAGGTYMLLPKLKDSGDQYIAVFDTGAYQDALASHHCLLSSPIKLIAQDGTIKVARKRETAEMVGKLFGWGNGDK